MESDSDGQEDEEVVGMKQRSLCLQDKVYTGKLQVSHATLSVILSDSFMKKKSNIWTCAAFRLTQVLFVRECPVDGAKGVPSDAGRGADSQAQSWVKTDWGELSSQNFFLPMYLDKLSNGVYVAVVLVHPVVYQLPHPPYLGSFKSIMKYFHGHSKLGHFFFLPADI